MPVTSSQRALQYLILMYSVESAKVLAREMALQLWALQFLFGKSDLPVTSSIRVLQILIIFNTVPK